MRSQNLTLDKLEKTRSMPVLEGIAIGLMMLLSIGASATYLYFQAVDAVKAEIKEGIQRSTASVAAMINGDEHEKFNDKSQKFDPSYLNYVAPLERARQASKYVPYIYTNILKDEKVYFIVNPSPQLDLNNDGFPDDAPDLMDSYDAPSQSLLTALTEQREMVDSEPYTDQWGTFISAYTPIYNSHGDFVGTLGMDLDFSGFEKRLIPTKNAFKTAAITGVVMAILVGVTVWFNRRTVKMLNHSRSSIIRKYVSANEFVRHTNRYRADLLALLSQCLKQTDARFHSDILQKFDTLAHLQREDATYPAINFNLGEQLNQQLTSLGLKDRIKITIAKNLPDVVNGPMVPFQIALENLLASLVPLGLNGINVKLEKESINHLLIGFSFTGNSVETAKIDFNKRFNAINSPGELPSIDHPDHLLPALACHGLTQLGADFDPHTKGDVLVSFTMKFSKFDEEMSDLQHA